jgi:ferredoxin
MLLLTASTAIGRQVRCGGLRVMMATTTTSSSAAAEKIRKLKVFLEQKYKYEDQVCEDIIKTLKQSGLPVTVSTARSIGNQGLEALVESIQAQKKSTEGRKQIMVEINVPHERHTFQVSAHEGDTVQDLSDSDEMVSNYLAFSCGGHMACSTCHCIVDEASFAQLDSPSVAEEDMLDMAADLRSTSRLGCQIKLFDGVQITIPEDVHDYFT